MSIGNIIAYLKGPGLSAVVLVIGVVSAFALYATLGSEGLMVGSEKLKQEIASKQEQLQSLEKQLEQAEKKLAEQARLQERVERLDDSLLKMRELKDSNEVIGHKLTSLADGLEQTREMFDDYKKRYRVRVRKEAVGTKFESLSTSDGKTYSGVEIKSVGAVGMSITHAEGSCRIGYKDLPVKLQQLYQFDDEEAEAKQRQELERRRLHQFAQQGAAEAEANRLAGQGEELQKQQAEQREKAIDEMRAAIRAIDRKLRNAKSKLKNENSKSISRAPQYRQEIDRLNQLKDDYQSRINELRSMR